MVASGTATLETALHKRPMVIAYKMQWLSWQLANRRRLVRWIGLPNILCEAGLVPELLQDQVRPEALVREVLAWLDDPARVQALRERFEQLHQALRRDSAALTVHAIDTLLQRRAGRA
jgi:lipid-A-disaccharide synthase